MVVVSACLRIVIVAGGLGIIVVMMVAGGFSVGTVKVRIYIYI